MRIISSTIRGRLRRLSAFTIQAITLVGGDAISPSVAAASILAKVTRDRELYELDKEYPTLGLAKHKGYPTKAHYAALKDYISENGEIPHIYRLCFLKNNINNYTICPLNFQV